MVRVESRIDAACEAIRSTFYGGLEPSAMDEYELGENEMTATDNVEQLSTCYTGLVIVEGSMSKKLTGGGL